MIQAYRINTDNSDLYSEMSAIPATELDCVNWKEYPYRPEVTLRLGYSSTALAILFEVSEEHILGTVQDDCGPVWENSCCEFFIENPTGEGYLNFEMNCIGTLLAARRKSRQEFEFLSKAELKEIKRFCSLPQKPVDIINPEQKYWIAEVIPFSILGLDTVPESIRANFYKCGDKCRTPHFVSLFPIGLPSPDFHCPEFFQEIIIRK